MPHHINKLINSSLNKEAYEDIRVFHAKTNNLLLFKTSKPDKHGKEKLQLPSGIMQKIENSDLPLVPYDANRIDISSYTFKDELLLRDKSPFSFLKNTYDAYNVFKLLNCSFGSTTDKNENTLRPYPSGGSLYPVQVIVAIIKTRLINASDLQTGFYHYRPNLKSLDLLNQNTEQQIIQSIISDKNSSLRDFHFCLIYGVYLAKSFFKYGYRSYRLALLEAGSMYQQASLIGKTLGLENRVWAGFTDYELAKTIGLNPCIIFPVVTQVFGLPENI